MKSQQTDFFAKKSGSYGGTLMKKRSGRIGARPISTHQTMHLVLRSSKATDDKSFKIAKNSKKIHKIINCFANKYGIHILSLANAGNHLHLHLKVTKRIGYVRFIRAISSAIAMHVTGINRWSKSSTTTVNINGKQKFWDYRPFTRIVIGRKDFLNMEDYIQVNQLEGFGVKRVFARIMIEQRRHLIRGSS